MVSSAVSAVWSVKMRPSASPAAGVANWPSTGTLLAAPATLPPTLPIVSASGVPSIRLLNKLYCAAFPAIVPAPAAMRFSSLDSSSACKKSVTAPLSRAWLYFPLVWSSAQLVIALSTCFTNGTDVIRPAVNASISCPIPNDSAFWFMLASSCPCLL